jgi:hypothetical protein
MSSNGQHDLYYIKQELQDIINEIESIASGIDRSFEGIGNEKCAAKLRSIADHYRGVKRKLGNIDTSKVKEA